MQAYADYFSQTFLNDHPREDGYTLSAIDYAVEYETAAARVADEGRVVTAPQQGAVGEAAGPDGIFGELLKYGARTIGRVLAPVIEAAVRYGYVPQAWKTALIAPVPKKGDLTDIANYRPISITSVLRKAFELLVAPHLVEALEPLS